MSPAAGAPRDARSAAPRELVPDQRERPEPEHGAGVLDSEALRPAQRGLGAREVRRIGRLPPAQLVREPELRQQRRIAGPGTNLGLEARDGGAWRCRRLLPRAPDRRAQREQPALMRGSETRRGRHRRARRGRARPQSRRPRAVRSCVSCRASSHLPTRAPCGRSPGSGQRRTGSSRGTGSRWRPRRLRPRCSECGSRCRCRSRSSR